MNAQRRTSRRGFETIHFCRSSFMPEFYTDTGNCGKTNLRCNFRSLR
jgi:hypothetical protein